MGPVQYLVLVWMFSAHGVLASPTIDDGCKLCPAGEFLKSCTVCRPCPEGKFTSQLNDEDFCHPCSADCRADYHLKVEKNCTRTSDTKCVCEAGFRCTEKVPYSDNCRSCERIQPTNPTTAAAAAAAPPPPADLSGNNNAKRSRSHSPGSSDSPPPPPVTKFGLKDVPPTPKADLTSRTLAAILCPVVFVAFVAVVILFCARRPEGETCFKRAVAKLHDGGRRASASYKSRESGRLSRDSLRPMQQNQPTPLATANMGPVHVHNPGTVIFSLLSQFTGHVGGTARGDKASVGAGGEETHGGGEGPVCHPTSSPGVPLSEEEGTGGGGGGGVDVDNVFFPSQEQGKDSHLSKEEEDGL